MNAPNQLYYRTKDNGASVYRVDTENRQKRMDLVHIANINLKKSAINPRDESPPTPSETVEIQQWIADRQVTIATRQLDDVYRMMDTMNETAQWIQTRSTSEQLDRIADQLLLSMHDLRSAIVRRKTDFLTRK
jgi:hypothetical protein